MIRRSSDGDVPGDAIAMALLESRGPPVWKNSAVPLVENAGENAGLSSRGRTGTGFPAGDGAADSAILRGATSFPAACGSVIGCGL